MRSSLPGITAASFAPTEEEGRGQGEYSWREASYLFHDAESSTTTYMLPRASGGSAVSRYFSAIESEYNDVVSEVFSPDGEYLIFFFTKGLVFLGRPRW